MNRLPEAWIAPPATRELRELVRYRAKIVALRSGLKAQVHAVLAKAGVVIAVSDLFGVGGRQRLANVPLGAAYVQRVISLLELIDALDAHQTRFSVMVADKLVGHAGYQAIQQLPGVGPVLGGHCHVGECRRPGRIGGVSTAMASYKGHRYPVEIINHCVWLYFRFPLSFREVEELMLVRGVVVSYETIRRWCAKFGQAYANQLRRRRPRLGDKWHLDEVFVKINGITGYLWRGIDQHGNVLEVLVQSRRNAKAAKRFFRKLLKGLRYVPRVLVTDKLASYGVAHRQLMGSVAHRQSRYLNNRAENSHQRTRQRERAMKRFKSVRHAQRFLSAFSAISAHFRPRRHRLSATQWRTEIDERFAIWREVTALDAAA